MMHSVIEAYCDDLNEFDWFTSLDSRLSRAVFHRIGSRGNNPGPIENLIQYDRPDVILVVDGSPVLTLEKTSEVPTGHNVGQRMARLVRSVECGVPVIKFFPFDALKHGAHANVCNLNARLLAAFDKMWTIHGVPTLAVNWPADSHGELISDVSAETALRTIISDFIRSGFDSACRQFALARNQQRAEFKRRCEIYESYGEPPPSLRILKTADALSELGISSSSTAGSALSRFKETVIYKIEMSEAKCRREDPYTGTQFIYDYLYCRVGPDTKDKNRGLVLLFPGIRKAIWLDRNPNDPTRKSSNWYLTANVLAFRDGSLKLR
jgi:hypothetical protein